MAGASGATSGQARTVLLVLICFLLGLGAGAFWYYRASHQKATTTEDSSRGLSEGTQAILKSLAASVEVRFYSQLDPATSEALRDFSARVDELLSRYEQAAPDKLKVVRHTTRSDSASDAAASDGLKVFNLDKGEACYLGLAISCNGQKETLAQLSPEWEAALESDLSRAIARVAAPKPAARPVVSSPKQVDPAIIAEVKRAVPNLESVSLADATQTLRVATLKQFAEAAEAMDRAVKTAEAGIEKAQSGSEADRQAAVKQLQQVQAEHTEKLKQITAHLQAQIAALQQMKSK